MKKINNNNFQCVNVPTETYTKKEQSPKGLGYSAVGYDLNYEARGVDNQIWVVQMKNNKKVWFKKSGMPIVTHEEPLIIDNETNEEQKEIIIKNEENEENEIKEVKEVKQDKKTTDYNYFYKYYNTKLKNENNKKDKDTKKTNKEIQNEIFEEWNRLKKNKNELEELLKVIKNK